MENKMNSIDWLKNQMGYILAGYETELTIDEVFQKAKELHKHEIMETWMDAETNLYNQPEASAKFAEKYYKEKFEVK